jgi:hypothetical protein
VTNDGNRLLQLYQVLIAWSRTNRAVGFGRHLLPLGSAVSASTTLKVTAVDTLPGFHLADLPRYLALHMADAHLTDWRFEPAADHSSAPDRIEWSFKFSPYAGGEVRSFTRPHLADRTFGAHRPITIEARLYLNGEYQALVEKQAVIKAVRTMPISPGSRHVTKIFSALREPIARSTAGTAQLPGAIAQCLGHRLQPLLPPVARQRSGSRSYSYGRYISCAAVPCS